MSQEKQTNQSKVIGALEKVDFPEFGIKQVTAKIDTGAYTGALHATNVREEEKSDKMVLHFSPFDHPSTVFTSENYFVKPVKSSNGQHQDRYFIDTEIIIDGVKYPIMLSLADRSVMKWPVLIGRRFLSSHDLLVDVTKVSK